MDERIRELKNYRKEDHPLTAFANGVEVKLARERGKRQFQRKKPNLVNDELLEEQLKPDETMHFKIIWKMLESLLSGVEAFPEKVLKLLIAKLAKAANCSVYESTRKLKVCRHYDDKYLNTESSELPQKERKDKDERDDSNVEDLKKEEKEEEEEEKGCVSEVFVIHRVFFFQLLRFNPTAAIADDSLKRYVIEILGLPG